MTQRSETLAQLEEVYGKIGEAADQVTIVRTMEASAAVLRDLYADVGGVDRVQDVVGGLRNEISKVDEISNALEAGGQGEDIIDQSVIDEELEDLERQAKLEEEKAEALKTEKRLASIDEINGANRTEMPQQHTIAEPSYNPIEEGIGALKRLSLDAEATPDLQDSDIPPVPTEREPNSILGS